MNMKKLVTAFVCATLLSAGAWANAIRPQVTLSQSSIGTVDFSSVAGALTSFWFTGTAAQCGAGRAGCLSGSALLDPNGDVGTFWIWIAGSNPALTLIDSFAGVYAVNPGSYSLDLEVDLNNGNKLTATLSPANLIAGSFGPPQFSGTYTTTSATAEFLSDGFSPSGLPGKFDFTVKGLNAPVSSGEIDSPVPEPSSLALLDTGVLGLAGIIRRKIRG
jgi:hypothetical protein